MMVKFGCSSNFASCSPPPNCNDPCSTIHRGGVGGGWVTKNRFAHNSSMYRPSICYRPLQQLYKTTFAPTYGNNSSRTGFACICRPSERYKTTNMTYGKFYHDNWALMRTDRSSNYDRSLFRQCYDNNNNYNNNIRNKSCYQSYNLLCDDRTNEVCMTNYQCFSRWSPCNNPRCTVNNPCNVCIISNRCDPYENQYWYQPTNDACCPTNCCENNISYGTSNYLHCCAANRTPTVDPCCSSLLPISTTPCCYTSTMSRCSALPQRILSNDSCPTMMSYTNYPCPLTTSKISNIEVQRV